MSNQDPERPDAESVKRTQKAPYAPPAIEASSPFETLALSCNQAVGVCYPGPYEYS